MTGGATVTLLAVDLAEAQARWQADTLGDRLDAHPGGRLAALARQPALTGARRERLADLAVRLPPLEARAVFEALVDDLAIAALHDAPFSPLGEVCDRLARAAPLRALELAALEVAPLAYPAALCAEPRADSADGRAGYVVWLDGPRRLDALRAATELLRGTAEDDERRDLVAALAAVLVGPMVIGQLLP